MNYEVIWDGTANTVRGRLLSTPAHLPVTAYAPEPLPPDVKPNRRGDTEAILRRLKATQGLEWFTVREVIEQTGLEAAHIHNALNHLRRLDEILRERAAYGQGRCKGVQRYRWIA